MGVCSIKGDQDKFTVTKYANNKGQDSFELISQNFDPHEDQTCLMAHCRWATTGRVTDANSHPHFDTITPGRLAVVHNGIISNYSTLRDFLKSKQVLFQSETDTEVIINLIAYYLNQELSKGVQLTLMDAIKMTLNELEGTWALVIMDTTDPNSLYICKKGSPILIGYDDDMCIISSELSAFSNYLRNYHIVPDNQIIRAHYNTTTAKIEFYHDDALTTLSTQTVIHSTLHRTSPDPYPHWTLREIMEQPEAAFLALNQGGRLLNHQEVKLGGFKDRMPELMSIRHLAIIASGTSFHAGYYGQKLLQSWGGFETVVALDASEFTLAELPSSEQAGVLVLSQSGETRDVIHAMELIRKNRPGVPIFSVVNVVESLIAREADCGIYLNAGREVGVASTKSFTNQVIVLHLVTIWFAQNRQLYPTVRQRVIQSLHNIKDLIQATLILSAPICDQITDHLTPHHDLFILGRDRGYPIAMEGALKIKEISYIHAEAYPCGSLKHGPLALISPGTPVILIRTGNTDQISHIDIAAGEVKTRGGLTISIGSSQCLNRDVYDYHIPIAKDMFLESLLSVIPLQYLAYRLAVKLGHPVDSPRNLAKVVTVV
jgi:glucosamine--fructose-6-phosphate aminotransferase (isomerizing)